MGTLLFKTRRFVPQLSLCNKANNHSWMSHKARFVVKRISKLWSLFHQFQLFYVVDNLPTSLELSLIIAGSLESANSSILAARRHFKEVVGKKIRILL